MKRGIISLERLAAIRGRLDAVDKAIKDDDNLALSAANDELLVYVDDDLRDLLDAYESLRKKAGITVEEQPQ